MRRLNKKMLLLCYCLILSFVLSGCSEAESDGKNENIELLEPVGVTADFDYVTQRNMYSVEVYNCSVNPVVTEYSFSKEQTFKSYGAIPGQQVEAGEALVYAQTKLLDRQTENIEDEIEDLEINHEIEMAKLNKDLKDAQKNEKEAFESYDKIFRVQPDDPCSIEHDIWEDQVRWPEYSYKNAIMRRQKIEDEIEHKKELYELEHAYILGNRDRITDKVSDTTVVTKTAGEIVACNYFANGDIIAKDTPLLAVGDTSVKVLNTEYISKSKITKALDVYAVIDGKRYEIQYENMEPEEYQQLVDSNENIHTTFILKDPNDEVKIGSYAAVIVEKDRRKKVLSVPVNSLKKEADGYYVYLYDGVDTTYVPVQIGMRDGLYAEVISGLSEGDKVLAEDLPRLTKNTGTVTRGDYSVDTELNGYFYYPFTEWLVNPAENGSTYLKEILVTQNEEVAKDQVLAILEVVPDQIEINRLTTQISRLESRLAELNVTKAACDAKGLISPELNIKISENERDTKLKRRELNKLSKYAGLVEIKAPYDGIIADLETIKPGDLIAPDADILEIANNSMSFIIVKDDKNQLNYGNTATVKVSGSTDNSSIEGRIVTVNNMSLSKKLVNNYSLLELPEDETNSIAGSVMNGPGRWNRSTFKVTVKVRSEKNVIMVPKAAVTVKDKSTYVTVVNEDGSVERRSFIPGGSDTNYYWSVEGLTEGMTVCWE